MDGLEIVTFTAYRDPVKHWGNFFKNKVIKNNIYLFFHGLKSLSLWRGQWSLISGFSFKRFLTSASLRVLGNISLVDISAGFKLIQSLIFGVELENRTNLFFKLFAENIKLNSGRMRVCMCVWDREIGTECFGDLGILNLPIVVWL